MEALRASLWLFTRLSSTYIPNVEYPFLRSDAHYLHNTTEANGQDALVIEQSHITTRSISWMATTSGLFLTLLTSLHLEKHRVVLDIFGSMFLSTNEMEAALGFIHGFRFSQGVFLGYGVQAF